MLKHLKVLYFFLIFIFATNVLANNHDFDIWIKNFKQKAISQGVSKGNS